MLDINFVLELNCETVAGLTDCLLSTILMQLVLNS